MYEWLLCWWWWVAPVVLATTAVVAVALVLYQTTQGNGRHHQQRFPHVLTVMTTRVETPGQTPIGQSAVGSGSANHGRCIKEQSQVTFTHLSSRAYSAAVIIYLFRSFIPAATYIYMFLSARGSGGRDEWAKPPSVSSAAVPSAFILKQWSCVPAWAS